jgi:hypothetical protein
VQSHEDEWSCICALKVSILPLSTILIFDFGIVQDSVVFFAFNFITQIKKYKDTKSDNNHP